MRGPTSQVGASRQSCSFASSSHTCSHGLLAGQKLTLQPAVPSICWTSKPSKSMLKVMTSYSVHRVTLGDQILLHVLSQARRISMSSCCTLGNMLCRQPYLQ